MTCPKRLLACAALGLSLTSLPAQAPLKPMPALTPPRAGYSFPVHATYTYSVDWRVFPAGIAVFHLDQDGQNEKVSVTSETVGAVNLIYRVSDKFQSEFNRQTGCSESFNRQLVEGRRQVTSELRFDYARGVEVYHEKNLISGIQKRQETQIPPCVTDDLSAIFYPASLNLKTGQSFEMPLADAVRTVAVSMKVEGREEVKTPLGTYQTLRVQPTADAGVVKNRGNIWIWYTDDDRHVPVQMRARLFWGTITFRLTGMESK